MTNVDRGFDARGVYSFRVSLPARMQAPLAQHAFHDALTAALRAMPGVASVAAVERSLGSSATGMSLTIDGQRRRESVGFQSISPGFFETMRIPLRGRDFIAGDRTETAAAAIVNEAFARRFYPSGDALGRHFGFDSGPGWSDLEIVGIARDTRPRDVGGAVTPMFYLPTETRYGFGAPTYLVRAERSPRLQAEIRATAARVDPDAVIFDTTPLEALIARQVATPKFYGLTATGFAAIAVLLAALGLYGVLSYTVSTRTREFGIRIAIGATATRVVAGVMREAVGTVLIGVAAGVGGAYYASRFLEALLFGVRPHDPVTLALVAVLFLIVAALAAYVPARRATRVDPVAALRAE
jgi:putative ABC transport system permease protein